MDPKRALEIIRSNGEWDDIMCYLFSRTSAQAVPHLSYFRHYVYSDCIISIKRTDDEVLRKHVENLRKYGFCEFLINKGEPPKKISITLNCECERISRKFIKIRIKNVNYDDHGTKISYAFSE